MSLGDPYIVLRALGEAVPEQGTLDPRTARDLVILDMLDRREISPPKAPKLMGTQAEQDKVWREVSEQRKAGAQTFEIEGLHFDFSGAAQAPFPSKGRRDTLWRSA